MKILIISDIHANLNALEAVLEDAGRQNENGAGYDAVWCLGDLVGYGPDPNECIERVRSLPELVCLIGNHDLAALGDIPLSRFNEDARRAASWTQETLTPENETYLRSLESLQVIDSYTLAHASPRQPVWEYVLDPQTANANFEIMETEFGLIGHSHVALLFEQPPEVKASIMRPPEVGRSMELRARMLLNPGSVGQPRDMDPRAAYAMLDTENATWEARRIAYDIEQVQSRIRDAGLPERQAIRLEAGW